MAAWVALVAVAVNDPADALATGHSTEPCAVGARLIALITALVLGLATATAPAVRASQQVTQQRDILISGLLISQSQRLGHANPALSRLLSVAAWRINPSLPTAPTTPSGCGMSPTS